MWLPFVEGIICCEVFHLKEQFLTLFGKNTNDLRPMSLS